MLKDKKVKTTPFVHAIVETLKYHGSDYRHGPLLRNSIREQTTSPLNKVSTLKINSDTVFHLLSAALGKGKMK